MALTTPRRSAALAAFLIVARTARADVVRVHTDGVGSPAHQFHRTPLTPTPILRAIESVHDACSSEITDACQAQMPRDPFEALFGLPPVGGRRVDVSNDNRPTFAGPDVVDPSRSARSMIDGDPFLRMAVAPPTSPLSSSSLIDEIFGDFDRMVDDMIDDMMDSALRFGAAAQQQQQQQQQVPRQQPKEEAGEAEAEGETEASSADLAEAALERMVNSFLGHVVSASASGASASSEDSAPAAEVAVEAERHREEEEDDGHPQAPRVSDGDVHREVPSRDDAPPDESVDEPTEVHVEDDEETTNDDIGASHGAGGIDPVAMAERIVQRGRAILEGEGEEAADAELRLRRRLTAVDEVGPEPEVRRRLARRLTEVVPFVGMPARVVIFPLGAGGSNGLRVLIQEQQEQEQQRPAPVEHRAGATPRLMLGCGVDSCLWDMYDGNDGRVSDQCAASLANVRSVHARLLQEEEQRERAMAASLQNLIRSNDGNGAYYEEADRVGVNAFLSFVCSDGVNAFLSFVWLGLFVASIYACLGADGDDEDDEECNPEDYVVLSDDDGNEPARTFTFSGYPAARNGELQELMRQYPGVHHVHASPPCKGFSAANQAKKSAQKAPESGVYCGVPVQIV